MSQRYPAGLSPTAPFYTGMPISEGHYSPGGGRGLDDSPAIGSVSGHSHFGSPDGRGDPEEMMQDTSSPSHLDLLGAAGFGASVSATVLQPPPRPQRAPARTRSSSASKYSLPGLEPSAWLGGQEGSLVDMTGNSTSPMDGSPLATPAPVASRSFVPYSSSDGNLGSLLGTPLLPASGSSEEHQQLMGSSTALYAALNAGASKSSVQYAGSSGHEHTSGSGGGSSSGHGRPGSSGGPGSSSQGHGAGSSGSHGAKRQSWGDGRRSPGPSSLLPSYVQPPPTAYKRRKAKDGGESDSEEREGFRERSRSFLGRPLKWRVRGGRPSSASFSGQSPALSPMTSNKPRRGSTSLVTTPTGSAFPDSPFGVLPTVLTPSPPASPPSFTTASTSLQRHQTTQFAIPEDRVPSLDVPGWPGLGPLHGGTPALPSPALTERSAHGAPEGLLDPRLGFKVGVPTGMASSAALSFRDDMDYSRPIGGLVNNRMHSSTTIRSHDSHEGLPSSPALSRRHSIDSFTTEHIGARSADDHV
ncbi:hypothetical protein EIP91_006579 [Steccherinum ochraceum]|uniref:Uncharacterized protein n=1 Tax=Steccherinum ochraceum TaxID=92696 RepID=A0A4V2MVI2_9APHY|nr:hypothetical protein EIP91_006579 [Steccherinum ochraceum]